MSLVVDAPYVELSGRAAFDDAIENEASPGLPEIQLTRLIEEGDVVVAEGAVQAALRDGGRIDALFCDVFHFRGDRTCRLVTYQATGSAASVAGDDQGWRARAARDQREHEVGGLASSGM